MEITIPAPAREILHQLNARGYEAYVVGGCVRDMILGRCPGDWDITTSALPQEIKSVFRRTVDTGIQHGTVTVLMGKEGYEVTTYRIDGSYSDGRHPDSVTFTPDLAEDLRRRDFTINAMAYNDSTGFVDIFGGVRDLENKVIRCVGNPMDRFTEDALRILRAIRFGAQLDFRIEEETFKAIHVIAPNMIHVSKERIQVELTKLLLSDHPEHMAQVYETGISAYVSAAFHQAGAGDQEASSGAGFRKKLPPMPVSIRPEKHLRWTAFLCSSSPKEAVQILKDLKLDNDTIGKVQTLVTWLPRILWENRQEAAVRRAMSQMDDSLFDDLLHVKMSLAQVQEAETAGKVTALEPAEAAESVTAPGPVIVPETMKELRQVAALTEEIRGRGDCIRMKDLAVGGNDVIAAGVKQGKAVGEALKTLFDLVLSDPSKNSRDQLLDYLRQNEGFKAE